MTFVAFLVNSFVRLFAGLGYLLAGCRDGAGGTSSPRAIDQGESINSMRKKNRQRGNDGAAAAQAGAAAATSVQLALPSETTKAAADSESQGDACVGASSSDSGGAADVSATAESAGDEEKEKGAITTPSTAPVSRADSTFMDVAAAGDEDNDENAEAVVPAVATASASATPVATPERAPADGGLASSSAGAAASVPPSPFAAEAGRVWLGNFPPPSPARARVAASATLAAPEDDEENYGDGNGRLRSAGGASSRTGGGASGGSGGDDAASGGNCGNGGGDASGDGPASPPAIHLTVDTEEAFAFVANGYFTLQPEDVSLGQELAAGAFARVRAGDFRGKRCAIKVQVVPAAAAEQANLLGELAVLKTLSHRCDRLVDYYGAAFLPPEKDDEDGGGGVGDGSVGCGRLGEGGDFGDVGGSSSGNGGGTRGGGNGERRRSSLGGGGGGGGVQDSLGSIGGGGGGWRGSVGSAGGDSRRESVGGDSRRESVGGGRGSVGDDSCYSGSGGGRAGCSSGTGGAPGRVMMVMELCEHGALREALTRGFSGGGQSGGGRFSGSQNGSDGIGGGRSCGLSWSLRCRVAQDVAEALRYLHGRGVLHRDVKTANVLLDGAWRAKLCDFNLAIDDRSAAKHAYVAGTTEFMSPEMLLGSDYSFPADMFSLGVTLWEMITGREPSENFLARRPQDLFAVDLEELERNRPDGCPEALWALATDLTDPEPDIRPTAAGSIDWLADVLRREFNGEIELPLPLPLPAAAATATAAAATASAAAATATAAAAEALAAGAAMGYETVAGIAAAGGAASGGGGNVSSRGGGRGCSNSGDGVAGAAAPAAGAVSAGGEAVLGRSALRGREGKMVRGSRASFRRRTVNSMRPTDLRRIREWVESLAGRRKDKGFSGGGHRTPQRSRTMGAVGSPEAEEASEALRAAALQRCASAQEAMGNAAGPPPPPPESKPAATATAGQPDLPPMSPSEAAIAWAGGVAAAAAAAYGNSVGDGGGYGGGYNGGGSRFDNCDVGPLPPLPPTHGGSGMMRQTSLQEAVSGLEEWRSVHPDSSGSGSGRSLEMHALADSLSPMALTPGRERGCGDRGSIDRRGSGGDGDDGGAGTEGGGGHGGGDDGPSARRRRRALSPQRYQEVILTHLAALPGSDVDMEVRRNIALLGRRLNDDSALVSRMQAALEEANVALRHAAAGCGTALDCNGNDGDGEGDADTDADLDDGGNSRVRDADGSRGGDGGSGGCGSTGDAGAATAATMAAAAAAARIAAVMEVAEETLQQLRAQEHTSGFMRSYLALCGGVTVVLQRALAVLRAIVAAGGIAGGDVDGGGGGGGSGGGEEAKAWGSEWGALRTAFVELFTDTRKLIRRHSAPDGV